MKINKTVITVLALVLAVAALLAVYFATRPEVQEGSKAFTVVVVHADGSEKTFEYRTDAEKLGAFLEEKGLIDSQGADPGMFHTVDGEKADWGENKSYWALYEGEVYANQGIFDTLITDGALFKLVYTLG